MRKAVVASLGLAVVGIVLFAACTGVKGQTATPTPTVTPTPTATPTPTPAVKGGLAPEGCTASEFSYADRYGRFTFCYPSYMTVVGQEGEPAIEGHLLTPNVFKEKVPGTDWVDDSPHITIGGGPDSYELCSVFRGGTLDGTAAYATPAEVMEFYERELAVQGWEPATEPIVSVIYSPEKDSSPMEVMAMTWVKDGVELYIDASNRPLKDIPEGSTAVQVILEPERPGFHTDSSTEVQE